MEIRQNIFELARWPLTTAQNLGSFVLDVTGNSDRHAMVYEEPFSRADTALNAANRAIRKANPDNELAQFEVLRAAKAVNEISKTEPEIVSEIGREVIEIALELPNEEKSIEIVEEVTKTSLESLAPPRPTRHPPLSD